MPTTVLIKKRPGDGSIYKLKEALSASEAETVLIEITGSSDVEMNHLRKKIEHNPHLALNVVLDLTGVINLKNWVDGVTEISRTGSIGNGNLPPGSNFVTIVRDDPTESFNNEAIRALENAFKWVIDGKTHILYQDIRESLRRKGKSTLDSDHHP
ncbi:hypothetical protein [Pseudomonas amygdali]|nr:hypothetical protein [Pseudomonas amygdali]